MTKKIKLFEDYKKMFCEAKDSSISSLVWDFEKDALENMLNDLANQISDLNDKVDFIMRNTEVSNKSDLEVEKLKEKYNAAFGIKEEKEKYKK